MRIGVCVLTSVHAPFDVRIFHKEARTLARAGYEVTLVAPGVRGEFIEGVRIVPVARAGGRLGRMVRTPWRLLREARRTGAAVFHFHDPELIPLGLWLRLSGRRVVYDVHEDVPRQVLINLWIPARLRRAVAVLVGALERAAGMFLSGIVAATPTIAARFPAAKTVLVQNFPLLPEGEGGPQRPYRDRPPWIAYVGVLSTARGIEEAVLAMARLGDIPGARLRLAGPLDPETLLSKLRTLPGWDRVDYLGCRPHPEIAGILADARVGLVTLRPTINYLVSFPIKMFEYMAAGIPAVASNFPLWKSIVEGAGAGLLVDPLDPDAVAAALRRLLQNPEEAEAMGRSGRRAFRERYNWTGEGGKLLAFYRRILGTSG